MSEINNNNNNRSHKKGAAKFCKRNLLKVDLTPMVDLGFLLISFFIISTTMHKPKAMSVIYPAENKANKHNSSIGKTKVLQLVLLGNDSVYYYNGDDKKSGSYVNLNSPIFREIINTKQQAVAAHFGNAKEMLLFINPSTHSNYGNVVKVLNEVLINRVTRYVLSDKKIDHINEL